MDSARVVATAKELLEECQRLRDEIARLRQVLIESDKEPVAAKREASSALSRSIPLTIPRWKASKAESRS